MSTPGAASSGESMPGGLGLNAWWDEPGYKRCDSFSRRGAFILHKLLKCDPAKFVYIMSNLYRAEAKDPQDITPHEWQTLLKHMGGTDEEIRDVQMRMGRPSASPDKSQSPRTLRPR
jgi:hypothetical protein